MFVIGGVPGLILVPLMCRYLPESEVFLEQRAGGHATAPPEEPGRRALPWRHGPSDDRVLGTSFLGLVLVYGLNTWLPQLMVTAGYPLSRASGCCWCSTSARSSACSSRARSPTASVSGVRSLAWFAGAAVVLALLSIRMAAVPLYVMVFLAGAFVFSAQALVFAYVGGSTRRTTARPVWAGPPGWAGSARSPARSSSARCCRRQRLSVGLLRVRAGGRPGCGGDRRGGPAAHAGRVGGGIAGTRGGVTRDPSSEATPVRNREASVTGSPIASPA